MNKSGAKEPKDDSQVKKEGPVQSVKGMRDLLSDEFFSLEGFFEKASEIALYYGFQPIQTPLIEREEAFLRTVGEYTDIVQKETYTFRTKGGDRLILRPEGTAGVMRAYIEHGMHTLPQPVMLFYYGPFFRHENPQRGRQRQFQQFGIEVLGIDKSVADAITIRVLLTILEEAGLKDIIVEINSLGDKECRSQYKKALYAYFKRHIGKLSANEKELLKNNPLRLLDSKNPDIIPLKEKAPEAMDYLTGASKEHFKEVLEYLDTLKIPFRINSNLVRGLDYYSQTVFEFVLEKEEETEKGKESVRIELGGGGRYDYLAKMLGAKKDIPSVGGALGVSRIISLGYGTHLKPRILKKPRVFFIQLGFEAKLQSLGVIEILRKAKLPVRQSLSKDGLSVQLGIAERLKISWVLILGQKEVLEESIIVRNMEDRSQQTVKIADLADYIKKVIAK